MKTIKHRCPFCGKLFNFKHTRKRCLINGKHKLLQDFDLINAGIEAIDSPIYPKGGERKWKMKK